MCTFRRKNIITEFLSETGPVRRPIRKRLSEENVALVTEKKTSDETPRKKCLLYRFHSQSTFNYYTSDTARNPTSGMAEAENDFVELVVVPGGS